MKNQSQSLYRGSDNKKAKITKAEKVFNAIQAERKALALSAKKETTA